MFFERNKINYTTILLLIPDDKIQLQKHQHGIQYLVQNRNLIDTMGII